MESISYFCLKDLYTALKEDKGDKAGRSKTLPDAIAVK